MTPSWRKIPCPKADLQLNLTLNGGQSFRWKSSDGSTWMGVFKNRVWVLSQTEDHLLYKCYKSEKQEEQAVNEKPHKRRRVSDIEHDEDDEIILKNYLRLDVDLGKYYEMWSKADPHFKESGRKLYGIRMLNQEISSMVEKLCRLYGTEIAKINDISFYNFPEVRKLCSDTVESELRSAGFGYRGKFIHQTACKIDSYGSEKWMEDLKQMPYQEAKKELMKLPGIGAKVADCICLMSLSHLEAIPVDTHIFQVASEIYLPHLKGYKSVTEKIYNEISSFFQNLYGEKAGWAHTVLFCSQLKAFNKEKPMKEKKVKTKVK